MSNKKTCIFLIAAFALLAVSMASANSTKHDSSGPCMLTAINSLAAYRLPDDDSDKFGVVDPGDTVEALARTVEGWVGFDPGVAQAGNKGLARHRWVLLNATVSPSCLTSVDLVTLADVKADLNASGH